PIAMSATPDAIVACKCPDPLATPTPFSTSTGVGVAPLTFHPPPARFTSGRWPGRNVPPAPLKLSCTRTSTETVDDVENVHTGPVAEPPALCATTCQKYVVPGVNDDGAYEAATTSLATVSGGLTVPTRTS